MRKFAITANSIKGEISYTYNAEGFLVAFHNDAEMNQEQNIYILKNLPLTLAEMENKFMKSSKVTVTEIPLKVTFAMFWDKWNDKTRSSKKKSEKIWLKFDEINRVKAFLFIQKYDRNRGNAERKYCETYLGAELWNN